MKVTGFHDPVGAFRRKADHNNDFSFYNCFVDVRDREFFDIVTTPITGEEDVNNIHKILRKISRLL